MIADRDNKILGCRFLEPSVNRCSHSSRISIRSWKRHGWLHELITTVLTQYMDKRSRKTAHRYTRKLVHWFLIAALYIVNPVIVRERSPAITRIPPKTVLNYDCLSMRRRTEDASAHRHTHFDAQGAWTIAGFADLQEIDYLSRGHYCIYLCATIVSRTEWYRPQCYWQWILRATTAVTCTTPMPTGFGVLDGW